MRKLFLFAVALGIFLFSNLTFAQDLEPDTVDSETKDICLTDTWCYTQIIDSKDGTYQVSLLVDPRSVEERGHEYFIVLLKDNTYHRVLMSWPDGSSNDYINVQVDVDDFRQLWPPNQVGVQGNIVWARWTDHYVYPNYNYNGTMVTHDESALVVCVDVTEVDQKPYKCS